MDDRDLRKAPGYSSFPGGFLFLANVDIFLRFWYPLFQMEEAMRPQFFEIHYQVLAPVDQHPCGPRVSTESGRNWVEACHRLRFKYGEENADRIQVDSVSNLYRDHDFQKVYHFNRYGGQ